MKKDVHDAHDKMQRLVERFDGLEKADGATQPHPLRSGDRTTWSLGLGGLGVQAGRAFRLARTELLLQNLPGAQWPPLAAFHPGQHGQRQSGEPLWSRPISIERPPWPQRDKAQEFGLRSSATSWTLKAFWTDLAFKVEFGPGRVVVGSFPIVCTSRTASRRRPWATRTSSVERQEVGAGADAAALKRPHAVWVSKLLAAASQVAEQTHGCRA